jgi:uncharacterized membrane protein YhaH (DUF805 family)
MSWNLISFTHDFSPFSASDADAALDYIKDGILTPETRVTVYADDARPRSVLAKEIPELAELMGLSTTAAPTIQAEPMRSEASSDTPFEIYPDAVAQAASPLQEVVAARNFGHSSDNSTSPILLSPIARNSADSPVSWAFLPLQRYAQFAGRARRKEYWSYAALTSLCLLATLIIDGGFGLLTGLLILAILIPSLAVQVRRFHDQDKSGWFILLSFIPYIGGLIILVFMCLEGTSGDNKYGPDPKAGE